MSIDPILLLYMQHEQTLLTLLPSLERTVSSYLSEVLLRNTDVFEFGVGLFV
jgi:hypothetical protein